MDATFAGNCYDGDGLGPLTLVARWGSTGFGVDGTAPRIAVTEPTAFATTLSLTNLSVAWSDSGSGVNPSSIQITLDGVPRTPTVFGSQAWIPTSGIPPGVHQVTTRAADRLGNTATTYSFVFTLATLTATAGTASLREIADVPVNPEGKVVGAPTTVTFRTPTVDVSMFEETLSASTQVGHGTIDRGFGFSDIHVVFENGVLPPLDQPVQTAKAGTATHSVAVLAPSSLPVSVAIPASTARLGDITVPVPTGYNTANSTATLVPASTSLGAATALQSKPVRFSFAGSHDAVVETTTCVTDHAQCAVLSDTAAYVKVPGMGWLPVMSPAYSGESDPEPIAATDPGCAALGATPCGQQPQTQRELCPDQPGVMTCGISDLDLRDSKSNSTASSVFGCSSTVVGESTLDLCTGAPGTSSSTWLGLYHTGFAYAVPGCVMEDHLAFCTTPLLPDRYITWSQDRATPSTGAPCPQNGRGSVTSVLTGLHANVTSTNASYFPADVAPTTVLSGTAADQVFGAKLGAETTTESGTRAGNLSFQIAHNIASTARPPRTSIGDWNRFAASTAAVTDLLGKQHAQPSTDGVSGASLPAPPATATAWWPKFPTDAVATTTSDLEAFSGVEFAATQSPTQPPALTVESAARFKLTFDCAAR